MSHLEVIETSPRDWTGRASFPVRDFVELSKPRIVIASVVAAVVGSLLTQNHPIGVVACVAVALLVIASSVFNQIIERRSDALMGRTRCRALVAERVSLTEAAIFGGASLGIGLALTGAVGSATTVCLGLLSFVLYVGVYTPLKKVSFAGTTFGAMAGAMPLALGWSFSGGELNGECAVLWAWLFAWQFPHFLAIAWIYQADYTRAKLMMVPFGDFQRRGIGTMAVGYSFATVGASLAIWICGVASIRFAAVGVVCGIAYVVASIRFALVRNDRSARDLMFVSLVYLLICLVALGADAVF